MKRIKMLISVIFLASVIPVFRTESEIKTELKLVQIVKTLKNTKYFIIYLKILLFKLLPSFQLFRHGDRTPVMTYPNDPYQEDAWQKYGGFGQLTQTGMSQHYEFGKFLRKHYASFLHEYYMRQYVKTVSTDFDRTLMSAYSLLTGLYSPQDYQVWNSNITWQPIPVHTTDKSNDKVK